MNVFNIITFLCLLVFTHARAVQESIWDLKDQVEDYVHREFEDYEIEAYNDISELFEIAFEPYMEGLEKRAGYESTISQVLEVFNHSGVLWTLLDALADHPDRVEALTNWTSTMLEGRNFTINVGHLLTQLEKASSLLNITAIVNAVVKSGLIESTLNGLLLDDEFRPKLVQLQYNFILSQKDTLKYIFTEILQKRDTENEDIYDDWFSKLTDDNGTAGSYLDFLENSAGAVLNSPIVGEIASDTLNALNDTGIAVYTIKRFLSTQAYLNVTGELVRTIVHANVIHLDFSGINIGRLAQSFLGNPQAVVEVVDEFLSGSNKFDFLGGNFSKYVSAVKSMIQDLENKGLFKQLNDYIFNGKSENSKDSSSSSSGSNSSKDKTSGASKIGTFKLSLICSLFAFLMF
ncbi:putative GPI-anchored protein 45 [Spathaspora sp. JA1]|nr:putative GPI-anchored protein 45 [Spathaspora sp. JA1]